MRGTNFIVLIFVLIASLSFSQDTIKLIQSDVSLHLNIRNAKIDTCFDYYFGFGFKTTIKKVTIDLKGSYERDNGINYLSHSERVSYKYGQTGYLYDTEKDIRLFYASVYYPFLKIFKAGYDYSYSETHKHSAYIRIKWKYISAEMVFLESVRRFKYLINPTIKKWDKLSLKANIEGLYIPDKFKWQNGMSLFYKIK